MKKLLLTLLITLSFSSNAFATCAQNNGTCTVAEQQATISNMSASWAELFSASNDFNDFLRRVKADLRQGSLTADTISAQAYYDAQSALYITKRNRIKTAMIAIGGCQS